MIIDKATIHYNLPLRVRADSEGMSVTQEQPNSRAPESIYLIPDELRELNEIAKLLGWEGF